MRGRIPEALIEGEGWRRLLDCAANLPYATSQFGLAFESRLESAEPHADLGILTAKKSAISSHFINRGELGSRGSADAALGRLFREVERDGSPLSRDVGGIMLEYDIAGRDPQGAPGVFLSPPEFYGHPSSGYTDPDRLSSALAAAGCPKHAGNEDILKAVFAALPPETSVSQGAFFPAREPPIIRLNIAMTESGDPDTLLDSLPWPGPPQPMLGALAEFRDLTPVVRFALDIHAGEISPRLGAEVFQPITPQGPANDAGVWESFIQRIERKGLCVPEKADGLRAWQGSKLIWGPWGRGAEWRVIHHFKFDLNGGNLTVRAYIFLLHQPMA